MNYYKSGNEIDFHKCKQNVITNLTSLEDRVKFVRARLSINQPMIDGNLKMIGTYEENFALINDRVVTIFEIFESKKNNYMSFIFSPM